MKPSLPYVFSLCLAAALVPWTAPAAAQEGEAQAADPMMEAWQASMTPGPQHGVLASMAGTWTFTMKYWPDPSGEAQSSAGTAERSLIFGGRVLVERVAGEAMGMAFEGLGHTGYDNVTGRWWSTWMDNMGTGVMVMQGTVDEETHTATWKGEMSDPMTGGKSPMKIVVQHEGPDKEVAEFYSPAPGGSGEMIRTMELTYLRQE